MMIFPLKLFFRALFKHKKPLFIFASPGITEDGKVELQMEWNKAFIAHINKEGFIGLTEEESVQQFLMSFTRSPVSEDSMNAVTSAAHPFLNEESGNMIKR